MNHAEPSPWNDRPVLVGCAHGTADPAGRAAIRALLDAVAAARPGLVVREAFVDVQAPRVAEVVEEALVSGGGPVVVVPLLLSVGFHVRVDVAAAVDRPGASAAPPLGPDPRLVDLLRDRLVEVGVGAQDAVVLAAAGSSDARAARAVEVVAAGLADRVPNRVTIGYGAGARPRVAEAVAAARTGLGGSGRVVVASYLLAPGYFHDRVRAAGADAVTAPLAAASGADARLVDLVLDRFDGALAAARREP